MTTEAAATYHDSIEAYRVSGLGAPLPVPRGRKAPPPSGFTGESGAVPSDLDYTEWRTEHSGDNTALRTSADVIGVDVDAYDRKSGAQLLRSLEEVHGPLPDTYRSSAREAPSGIRWFVADPDLIEQMGGEFGAGIEIIRYQHRYAVVAPSIHPNGDPYRWYGPDGELMSGVPERSALLRTRLATALNWSVAIPWVLTRSLPLLFF